MSKVHRNLRNNGCENKCNHGCAKQSHQQITVNFRHFLYWCPFVAQQNQSACFEGKGYIYFWREAEHLILCFCQPDKSTKFKFFTFLATKPWKTVGSLVANRLQWIFDIFYFDARSLPNKIKVLVLKGKVVSIPDANETCSFCVLAIQIFPPISKVFSRDPY